MMGKRGYTLVELLVVLAIGAILLAIAFPGYAFLINASRLMTVTNDLVTALHLARSEAIKRGTRVSVCKTASATSATPACDTSADWQQGWLVFVDGGTRGVMDTDDTLLQVYADVSSMAIISASNYDNYVSYLPHGRSQASNGLPNGALRVCVAGNRRDIIVNSTGRIRLSPNVC